MAGFEFRRLATGRAAVNSARGTFTFNGTQSGYAPADFILGASGQLRHGRAGNPRTRGRVARWILRARQVAGQSRKLTLNYGIRYELPTVPYTINGIASFLNADQTRFDRGARPGSSSSSRSTRTGRRAWASPTASTRRRRSAEAAASTTTRIRRTATRSSTRIRHGVTILQCNWSSGLPTLSLSNPLAVPAACPLPGSNSGA